MKKFLLIGGGRSHVEVMRGFGLRSAADISVTVVMAETAALFVDEVLPEQPLRHSNKRDQALSVAPTWSRRIKCVRHRR